MADTPAFRFEGVIGYSTGDANEAAHFFEHALGMRKSGEDGALGFYELEGGVTLMVDMSGASAGEPPFMMFSTTDLGAAAEHFLGRGCAIKELPWAPGAPGFIARTPEGHAVCIVEEDSLGGADTP